MKKVDCEAKIIGANISSKIKGRHVRNICRRLEIKVKKQKESSP